MRQKLIKQIGYVVSGEAVLRLWGGGEGAIRMEPTFIPTDKFSKTNMLRAVNDGGFGCEAIESAMIEIHVKYDNGSLGHEKTFYDINHPIHTKHFLGWAELHKQGIKS